MSVLSVRSCCRLQEATQRNAEQMELLERLLEEKKVLMEIKDQKEAIIGKLLEQIKVWCFQRCSPAKWVEFCVKLDDCNHSHRSSSLPLKALRS